jgi:hypothetical protein
VVLVAELIMVLAAVLMVLAAELIMVLAAVLIVLEFTTRLVVVKLQTDFETVKVFLVVQTVAAHDRRPTRESSPITRLTDG